LKGSTISNLELLLDGREVNLFSVLGSAFNGVNSMFSRYQFHLTGLVIDVKIVASGVPNLSFVDTTITETTFDLVYTNSLTITRTSFFGIMTVGSIGWDSIGLAADAVLDTVRVEMDANVRLNARNCIYTNLVLGASSKFNWLPLV
jgi:hypothetical protein